MKLSNVEINRVKIKDLMAALYKKINPNEGLGLMRLELLHQAESSAIKKATDGDLSRIEKLFIEGVLGIEYFPLQNKKRLYTNGQARIVPIDFVIPSEAEESHPRE